MPFFTAQQAAHLAATTARVAWLAKAQFKSETVRLWAGDSILDAAGQEWHPTYGLVQIDGLGFTGEPVSRQITMTVSGVDAAVLPLALSETHEAEQQPLIIYLQLFDAEWQVAGGLIPLFHGLMQPPRVTRSEATESEGAIQSVSLSAENFMFNRAKPPNGRYTDRDQNKRTTGDRFFEFMHSLRDKTYRWPDF